MSFDEYHDSYRAEVERSISFARQDLAFFTEAKANHLLEVVRHRCGAPSSLSALDVGCGVGATDQHLVSHFRKLHGVDVAPKVVAAAATANPSVEYKVSDGETLPYEDGSFDVAFTICVLHHLHPRGRRGFVGELLRVTKAGGLVLVFEHNPFNPLTRLAVSRCEFDRDATLISLRAVSRLAVATGLQVLESRYILFFPWRASALQRLEPRLRRLPLGAQYLVAARRPA